MANVISVEKISGNIYRMIVAGAGAPSAGQFYMLRAPAGFPSLSRPISAHDFSGGNLSFLFRASGEGTRMLAAMRPGDEIETGRPLGRGFIRAMADAGISGSLAGKRAALVGGGLGIAPLFLAARELAGMGASVSAFFGYSEERFLERGCEPFCDEIVARSGGYITDDADPARADFALTCGPMPMMRALAEKFVPSGVPVFVSLERRMACGYGVCLGCSIPAGGGRARVCREGPVFEARDIFSRERS